jgi:hypothetical protein
MAKEPTHERYKLIGYTLLKVKITLGAVLLVLTSSAASHADWQYTKWGMTQEEVITASNNIAIPTNEAEREANRMAIGKALLVAPYISGQFEFQAFFIFEQQIPLPTVPYKLVQVRLKLRLDKNCDTLQQILAQKYGNPITKRIADNVIFIASWRDEAGGNELNLKEMYNDCTLVYSPLKAGDAAGL